MATRVIHNQFNPDYSVHPGEILEETLGAQGISHKELCDRTGLSMKTISLITHGKASVSSETAIHFERALGVSAKLWSNLDSNYRLQEAKKEQLEHMKEYQGWLHQFPVEALASQKIIRKSDDQSHQVGQLLSFFGVSSPDGWRNRYEKLSVNYRRAQTFESSWESVTCWLRLSEIEASTILTKPFRAATFRKSLQEIRGVTTQSVDHFQGTMRELCAEAGVALTFVPELPKARLCGATLWLSPDTALLSLSLRYKSDDQFWFSFYHEAGHLLIHGKRSVFLEENGRSGDAREDEANHFATRMLFPGEGYEEFVTKGCFFEADILKFAKSLNLAPGIVVGRLQHDGHIKYQWHNRLKRRFTFVNAPKEAVLN